MNVELALEFAKELTWENRNIALDNQPYILGEQHHRLHRLDGKVDAIITDCPIPMGTAYLKDNAESYKHELKEFAVKLFESFDNLNFFLRRGNGSYRKEGRIQTLEESMEKDSIIEQVLVDYNIPYTEVISDGTAVQNILIDVVNELRRE